jgi:hypothetical protein
VVGSRIPLNDAEAVESSTSEDRREVFGPYLEAHVLSHMQDFLFVKY